MIQRCLHHWLQRVHNTALSAPRHTVPSSVHCSSQELVLSSGTTCRGIYVINEVTNWEQRTLYNDRLQQIDVRAGCCSPRTGSKGGLGFRV